jgi:Type II secretion system (T2SS), protein M
VKRNEQIILAALGVIGLIVGFWLLIVSPKRDEASKLESQVSDLQSSLSDAQQQVTAGEKARGSFAIDYRRLVVLGKAVPADSEQASLMVQLQRQAARSGVQFQAIDLSQSSDASSTPPATPTPPPSTDSSGSGTSTTSSSSSTSSDTSTATPAPATEAAASTLPIGATVGPAGLPVMDYDLDFTGEFFQIADFMNRVDSMVHTRGGLVDAQGRLLTVNGFTLQPSDNTPSLTNPVLTAQLHVTTYLTPADEGLTAGATPAGPASVTPTLTSTSTPTGSSTSTTSTDSSTSTTAAP